MHHLSQAAADSIPRKHLVGELPRYNRPVTQRSATPPRLLTIAGSDSGGGAGIQADLKTFAAHGAFGMTAVTAVTAQNTVTVSAIHPVPPHVVAAQIDAVFDDIGVDAVKIGMLASSAVVRAVADRLQHYGPAIVVLDPVMIAKSGDPLLADEAVTSLVEDLLPLATVLTPNLPEAARITGLALSGATSLADLLAAARLLAAMSETADGSTSPSIVLKGGHAEGNVVRDLLWSAGEYRVVERERLDTTSTHGTGCTLSSAIAARLATGESFFDAVPGAIDYLRGAIAHAPGFGSGHGPVDHLYRQSHD